MKVCIATSVGSDHVNLNTAATRSIEVLKVTGSNVLSVAEHAIMSILLLIRNFVPAHGVRDRSRPSPFPIYDL